MSMNFLKKMFRREERNYNPYAPDPGNPFVPTHTPSPHVAENLSTVFACVSAISSTISALPVFVYRIDGKARQEVADGPVQALVKGGPNPWQSWPEFCEMLVAQVLLRGNGLVEILSDRSGAVTGLRVIPWHWCNCYMLPNGQLVYDVCEQPGLYSPAQGKRRRLLQSDVIHIKDRSDDGLVGRSRLQRAASVVHGAQSLFNFTNSLYENGMYPSVIMTHPADLRDDQLEGIRKSFQRPHMGPQKAGRMMVIPGEFKIEKMTISPEDAELLQSRKFSTEELCRLFQVPPPIVQDYSHNTFTNSTAAARWFCQFTLLPWIRKIESAFNRALFPDGDFELSLDMSALTRGDDAARWQAHEIAARNQILTIDELREEEGYGPKPVHQSTSACTSNES